jgi:cell division protein FtsN
MTREYENRRSSRRSKMPNQLLVISVTFVLGYLTASFFDFETLCHWINNQVLAHQEIKKVPAKADNQHATNPPKPKFEFYTLLTNEKVPNPQANTNSAASTAASATHTSTNLVSAESVSKNQVKSTVVVASSVPLSAQSNRTAAHIEVNKANTAQAAHASTERGNFLVQVASFKARQDAEHMKGSLILKGFSVYIIPVSHATKGNWYRVVVGPYTNRFLAQQAQKVLANNERLHGMITNAG